MKCHRIMTLASIAFITSCGQVAKNKDTDKETSEEASPRDADYAANAQLVDDQELQGETIETGINDAIAAVAQTELSPDSGAAFGLVQNGRKRSGSLQKLGEKSRECESVDGQAQVSISRDYDGAFNASGPRGRLQKTVSYKEAITRLWSQADQTVGCTENNKHVNLKALESFVDLQLEVDFERSTSSQKEIVTRRGKEFNVDRSYSAKGTRQFKWLSDELADQLVTRNFTISSQADHTWTVPNKDGESSTLTASFQTDADGPLNITTVRHEETKDWESFTINSGKVRIETRKGAVIEIIFEAVRFEPSTQCRPVSGTTSGEIYESADATTPSETFSVDFSDEDQEIEFGKGRAYKLGSRLCALSENEG